MGKSNSAKMQKIIRDFEKYFEKKYGSLDAWPPDAYPQEPPELSDPPTIHEMLRFKEFRIALNKDRKKKGKIPFV